MPVELTALLKVNFRLLLPTTKTRRVQAAIAAIASRIVVSKLNETQLEKLDAEIVQIYKRLGLYPWWNLRAKAENLDRKACEQAVAMWRLGMPTGIAGRSWADLLHPWHSDSPTLLIQDFRPYHQDTDEALARLSAMGFSLPADLHYGQTWLAQRRGTSEA